jgi:aspartyl-tRNA(Asn)/glutamyl-tRNA(Gln) amidotransferase subunit B
VGAEELGTKVEVKNMNSFRSVYSALIYEFERQSRVLDEGGNVAQETRGWVEDRGVTVSQRSKEYASDYRYFPEPDLPALAIDPSWIDEVQGRLPELPDARAERYSADYGLSAYVAGVLTASRSTSDFFESVLGAGAVEGPALESLARSAANWMVGELARLLNATGGSIDDLAFEPARLVELIRMVDDGTLSTGMARTVFEDMFESGDAPKAVAERRGLVQISDEGAVQAAVDEAIESNPQPVADYVGGKGAAIGFLVGQVMRITRGKANPQVAGDLLKQRLESMR